METVRALKNKRRREDLPAAAAKYNLKIAAEASAFHKSFPAYEPTPLVHLPALADRLKIKGMYVKDESKRFDINSFKVLGGSYAIGSIIAEKLGRSISDLSYADLVSEETKNKIGPVTFITATDGNHGRGVAWTANRLGQRCIVYLPAGTAQERLDNILALGAEAEITELSYDDAVRRAAGEALSNGYTLVQDTSAPGFEDVPEKIMQGYITMALEAYEQLGGVIPTHIFLQAGVGSMAAAVAGFFANIYRENRPKIIIVEPSSADCLYESAAAGRPKRIYKDMNSEMAGLCCGEPCAQAWEVLDGLTDYFIAIPDAIAEKGMRVLSKREDGDEKIVSGESGACTAGLVCELLDSRKYEILKRELGLCKGSVVLCFSTEGATNRANYDRIVGNSG